MTLMTSWDLFDDHRAARDEVARMNGIRAQRFSQPGQRPGGGRTTPVWAPAVDISERADAYLVTVELAGVPLDDLEITFEDGLMTIQGERHFTRDSSAQKVHRIERRYGTFRRSIVLPRHVTADTIEASAHDGVLQIVVPKTEEAHAKRIQVHACHDSAALTPGTHDETRT